MLAVLAAGCSGRDYSGVEPFVAVAGYYSIMAQQKAPPAPAPQPDSGMCEVCHGLGVVGDGVQRFTCSACGGTGRKPKSVLVPTPRPSVFTISPKAPCASGTCTTRAIVR